MYRIDIVDCRRAIYYFTVIKSRALLFFGMSSHLASVVCLCPPTALSLGGGSLPPPAALAILGRRILKARDEGE